MRYARHEAQLGKPGIQKQVQSSLASEAWQADRAIADIWRAGRAQVSGDCGGGAEVKLTPAQELLKIHLNELGQGCDYEVRFCDRNWRFDIALPLHKIAIEISGGNWTGGHRRGKAQESEYDKLNIAQMYGWRCLQFTNRQVLTGEAKEFLKKHLSLVDASPRGQRHSRRAKVGAMESE